MQYKNNVASQINISLVGILGSISYVTCNIQLFLLSRKVGQSKATEMKVAAGMSKPASRFFSFLQATLVFASISGDFISNYKERFTKSKWPCMPRNAVSMHGDLYVLSDLLNCSSSYYGLLEVELSTVCFVRSDSIFTVCSKRINFRVK